MPPANWEEPRPKLLFVHATVNGVVVEPVIATGKAGSAALRGELGQVVDGTTNRGDPADALGGDVGGRTGALLVEGTVELSADDDFIELEGALGNGTGQVIGLAEAQNDFFNDLALVAQEGEGDGVGTAHTHVGDPVGSVGPGYGAVNGARWRVNGNYGGAGNRLLSVVQHNPGEGGGRYLGHKQDR